MSRPPPGFHVYKSKRQRDRANYIFGNVGGDTGRFLWPGNPNRSTIHDLLADGLQMLCQCIAFLDKKVAVRMGETSWGIDALSQREKSLLSLMMDMCRRDFGSAFEMHVNMAVANDVSSIAIKEVIYHATTEASTQVGQH
jgi:alkylhydroperoxidase/carboxymuconolactone decarboxylase family protein YurZ